MGLSENKCTQKWKFSDGVLALTLWTRKISYNEAKVMKNATEQESEHPASLTWLQIHSQ